ncbi:hypothetical protein NC652_033933 [Populus alba x Populus x berolinensis]|nr:hypothetical protein NC652_033933 [Populus alba x Populus x berolinensis]
MGLPLNSVLGASKIAGFVSSLLFYVSTNSGVEVGSILAVYSGVATGWVVYTVVAAESGFVLWCCFHMVCTIIAVNLGIAASSWYLVILVLKLAAYLLLILVLQLEV